MKALTPLKALRAHCIECCLDSRVEVRECPAKYCPAWPLRFGKKVGGLDPLRLIRKRCLDCYGGSIADVRDCPIPDCPLYPFRFGGDGG
jgi:hypothetical protein